jgi:hypothetical protein
MISIKNIIAGVVVLAPVAFSIIVPLTFWI